MLIESRCSRRKVHLLEKAGERGIEAVECVLAVGGTRGLERRGRSKRAGTVALSVAGVAGAVVTASIIGRASTDIAIPRVDALTECSVVVCCLGCVPRRLDVVRGGEVHRVGSSQRLTFFTASRIARSSETLLFQW